MSYKCQAYYVTAPKFISREAEIEFLIPDRGRGDAGPYHIKELAIKAQSLRLVDMLIVDAMEIQYGRHRVKAPDPIRFCFHKLLVSKQRTKKEKREKDRLTAFELAELLSRIPTWRQLMPDRFKELSKKHRAIVLSLLKDKDSPAVAAICSVP